MPLKSILNLSQVKAYFILIILAIFMLGTNPFKSETLAPMDLLVKYPGWQNTRHIIPTIHGERSDVLDAKLPIWISAKHDLHKGELPLWNHQRAGKPAQIFTNSLFTPAFFTFALVEDDALGFYLSNLVNVLIGLVGMFLFLRLFFNVYASMLGSFIFMFSGFNTAWFYWAHVNTAIWTPWVLFAVYRYLDTKDKKYLPFITFTMLMLNLGGFPMVAVMTYIALAVMVLLHILVVRNSLKVTFYTFSYLISFSILSVIIAIPFIYPLVELLEWMGGMRHRSTGAGFSLIDFKLFIAPDTYRFPRVETTLYVGILPLVLFFISLVLLIVKPRFIAFFALLVLLLSVGIAFTFIDPELLKKIPLINSSLFTRFNYLIGLALAITAAYVFHELLAKVEQYKYVPLIIIILFFGTQIRDQRSLFKRFNAAVPASSFYPTTATLSYLQETLKPYQYVMADSGFLISGTLGGYRLNDWFAHSFHQRVEKEVLRKIVKIPFKTPTSSMFNFSQIDLDSPYIDYLGIKAILATRFSPYVPVEFIDNNRKKQPCPTLPTNKLRQTMILDKTYTVEGLQIHMATYGQKHASSDVVLTLKKEGTLIATLTADKLNINDNTWVSFLFESTQDLHEGTYTIEIKLKDESNAQALTVWSNTSEKQQPLWVNNKKTNLSFQMRFIKHKTLNPKYKLSSLEPNIHLLENTKITENAYYIKTLDEKSAVDYAPIKTELISNSEIHIHYLRNKEGWVVLPMHHYPGWAATVNGKTQKIESFLGFLPAVKINTKSDIILTYVPTYSKVTYLLSLLGLVILVWTTFRFRKRD